MAVAFSVPEPGSSCLVIQKQLSVCFQGIYQQLCWGLQQQQQLSPKLAAAAIDTVLLVDGYGISCALLLVSIVAALQPVAAILYSLSKNREIEGDQNYMYFERLLHRADNILIIKK